MEYQVRRCAYRFLLSIAHISNSEVLRHIPHLRFLAENIMNGPKRAIRRADYRNRFFFARYAQLSTRSIVYLLAVVVRYILLEWTVKHLQRKTLRHRKRRAFFCTLDIDGLLPSLRPISGKEKPATRCGFCNPPIHQVAIEINQ